MDFELRAAREKLEREQRERKEKARVKLDRERKAKAEAARQRDAIESAQRNKRIDAVNALLKAEQQMEESQLLGKGVVFFRTLEALPYDGHGDKIKLPPSCFTELSDQGALDKGPMYFRLSRIDEVVVPSSSEATASQHNGTTHSGVLEFTAREGTVELPPHVWSNLLFSLDNPSVPLIDIRYVSLPKGTYTKLQAEEMGFSDIPNHKAVLETALRNHATLSQGDTVRVHYGELIYKLRVLELKPASSVSVLETDIEVDIEGPPNSLSDGTSNTNPHVLIPLVLGKAESGIVEDGKFNYYKFSIEDSAVEKPGSDSMNVEVNIEADAACDGDTDIYVSRHPLIFPTQHLHEWSSHEMGSKVLILPSLAAGTYTVGVFGFKGLTKYHLLVSLKDSNSSSQRIGEHAAMASSQVDSDVVQCRNCRHYISSRTVFIHEAYCTRHNVICQHDGCGVVLRKEEAGNHVHCGKCGGAFQQAEMEKHMKVFHEPRYCACGVILEKEEMVQHQSSSCPLRLISCRFCGDMVQAGMAPVDPRDRLRGLSEHESICGSRTTPCDSCGRSVMLKEMDIHVIAVHQRS